MEAIQVAEKTRPGPSSYPGSSSYPGCKHNLNLIHIDCSALLQSLLSVPSIVSSRARAYCTGLSYWLAFSLVIDKAW